MNGRRYKKNEKKNKFKQFFIFLFFLIILIGIIIPLTKKIKINIAANKEIKTIEENLEALEKNNSELRKLISYFGTSEYVEEQARTNLNYRKTDEKVAIIYNNNKITEQNMDNNNLNKTGEENINNAKRWKQYFFLSR